MSEQTTETNTQPPQTQEVSTPPTPGQGAMALQALMERERNIQTRSQEVKKQEAEIQEANRIRMLAKQNPTQLLREMGLNPSELKAPEPDPLGDTSKEVNQLKEEFRKLQEEKAAREREEQLNQARQHVLSFIEESDQYPFTKALPDLQAAVFDRMVSGLQAGQSLSEHEATQEVEDWLVQTAVPNIAKVIQNSPELMGKYFPDYVKAGQHQTQSQTPLTNRLGTETGVRTDGKKLTEQEEIDRMIEIAFGRRQP